ncbi:MAG TPA: hypothetical protein VGH38_10710 [Bryobacteraceae bacterium]
MRLIGIWLVALVAGAEVPGPRLAPPNYSSPLAFEAHGEQFVAHGTGYTLSIAPAEAVLHLKGAKVRMRIAGASRHHR